MSAAAALLREALADPAMRAEMAEALAPYLHGAVSGGWLTAPDAVAYLGLGSLDALDRLVRDGLPCTQPHGRGGRRYFERAAVDKWMRGG